MNPKKYKRVEGRIFTVEKKSQFSLESITGPQDRARRGEKNRDKNTRHQLPRKNSRKNTNPELLCQLSYLNMGVTARR